MNEINKILDRIARSILKFFRSKSLKYGFNSILLIAIIIAIVVVVNLLVEIPGIEFDLTPGKMYSIGDVSKELLNNLDKDVEIVALFDELQPPSSYYVSSADANEAMKLIYAYAKYPHVKLTFIDPDKSPGFMYDLDKDGSMSLSKGNFVVRRDTKKKKLVLNDLFEMQMDQNSGNMQITGMKAEEAISGAIKYVAAEETPVVYFIEGHGEIQLSSFKNLQNYLLNNNYLVSSLNLISADKVPEEAELLVFASPKMDLFPREIDILSDYFRQKGGKAMFMFDYDESGVSMENFNRVLGDNANLAVNNDKVGSDDDNFHLPDDPYTIMYTSGRNTVFPSDIQMILSDSRSVTRLKNAKEWITQTSLLSTNEKSYSQPIGTGSEKTAGPLDIAVAVENKGGMKVSKIVAIGNGSFINDSAVNRYGQFYNLNSRMFLYSLRWMFGEQDTLTIEPKVQRIPRLTITEFQTNVIGLFLVIALPLIIMGSGFVVYVKRRHL